MSLQTGYPLCRLTSPIINPYNLRIVAFYVVPEYMPADNILMAVLIGLSSGLTATGADQVYRQIKKSGGEA